MDGNTATKITPLEAHEIKERLARLRPNSGLVRVTQRQGPGTPDTFEGKFIGFGNIGVEIFSLDIPGEGETSFAVNRHSGILNIEIVRPF